MILHLSYEEVTALGRGAEAVLHSQEGEAGAVAAPPASRAAVEALVPLLTGDLSVTTLEDQRHLLMAAETIVEALRVEMDSAVVATHPAHEIAVAAYFEYAHALASLTRIRDMGREMDALLELLAGPEEPHQMAREFTFPD